MRGEWSTVKSGCGALAEMTGRWMRVLYSYSIVTTYLLTVESPLEMKQSFFALRLPLRQAAFRTIKIFEPMNSMMVNIDATFVKVVSVLLLEKFPKTYPIIKTILAINNTLDKMNPINIIVRFNCLENLFELH